MAMFLDGYGDPGFLLRDPFNLDGIPRTFRQEFPLFGKLLNDHVDHVIDVREGFFSGAPGSCAAHAFKRRTVGVLRPIALGVFVRFHHRFEAVGFQ